MIKGKNKFYLNRYAIAIYGMDDYLIYIADNVDELSKKFNLKKACVQSTLSHHKTHMNINGKRQQLILIDMEEPEA